jgi:hypothetical protein
MVVIIMMGHMRALQLAAEAAEIREFVRTSNTAASTSSKQSALYARGSHSDQRYAI